MISVSMCVHTHAFRVKTCCGFVYRGRYGDYLVDTALYRRCDSHHHENLLVSTATAAESSSVDSGNDNDMEEEELDDDDDDDASPASSSYLGDDVDCDTMTDDVYVDTAVTDDTDIMTATL